MNRRKRFNLSLVLMVTALLYLTGNISAQQRQRQGKPPIPNETQINKMVDELSAELSLGSEQKTKILAFYQNHFAEVKSSMNSGQRPSRESMESLREEFEDDVKNILNDEQQDLFDAFIKNNKTRQGQGRQREQNRR